MLSAGVLPNLALCTQQGVLLTHRAVVSVAAATKDFLDQISCNIGKGESVNENDCILSYLPLAHIFDRCVGLYLSAVLRALPAQHRSHLEQQ